MKANRKGRNVVLVMRPEEAKKFEEELLWCPSDDELSKQAWEALNALSEGGQPCP